MYETAEKQLRLVTVVEERNKNRHPPLIARNSSDHRRGAVIGEKGDKGSSGSFSRFTGTCIELIDVVNPHNPFVTLLCILAFFS